MSDEKIKVIEKHYIEIPTSSKKKFYNGLISGLGYGIGLTIGTSLFFILLGIFLSRVDLQSILGRFLSDVIQATQPNIKIK